MMSKRLTAVLCIAAATAAVGVPSVLQAAASGPSVSASEMDALPGAWFVQLRSAPAADGTAVGTLKAEKQAFRAAAAQAGVKYKERYAFDTLWNGLSITAGRSEINRIRTLSGVTAVWPVAVIEAPPKGSVATPELYNALAMTGADIAQSELGYTGTGIKVAVMDTGIDVDHPAFGGDGVARQDSPLFPSTRIPAGYDFVGNAFNADSASPSYNPVPSPDANPDDCGGHGTHVAGIVGANDATNGLRGVAPDVTFGAYRVFGCEGSTTADIMIAAMERALADGMHVLNMSIGSAFQWPQYPTAEAADRLVNKGMVVVASIGNSGASGLYSASAPGLGQKVIGTASFENTRVTQGAFSISADNRLIGYNPAAAAPPPPATGTFPMARTGTPASTADACAALPAGSLTGRVALIRRGTCSFHIKSLNAMNAGAAGVVFYNNQPGQFSPTVAGTVPITIPAVAITAADGVLINDRIALGPVSLTWGAGTVSSPNPAGGLIAASSSYGLAPDLALKPDIGAPGGNIWSSYPLEKGGYLNNSGTSMAAPHVAGAAALVLQAKPRTNSQVMRAILQNSADPKVWGGNPGLGFLDNVHRQGAGMLDIDDAILATTRIEPGKIAAGEGQAGPYTQKLKIENNGPAAVTYDLSFANALSTGGVITPSFFSSDASVAFSAPSVAVPAGGTAYVDATITPATTPVNGQYGGYIVFTPQDGGQVYRVPFAGFVGDYQGIQVLLPTANNFPWLARLVGVNYVQQSAGAVFTLQAGDVPYFLTHFDHQARTFRVELFDEKGKAWHRAYDEDYLPRNSTPTSFFSWPFDGTTVNGKKLNTLPDGTYYAKLSVLKALGDSGNPAHWETWTSPTFVIDRP